MNSLMGSHTYTEAISRTLYVGRPQSIARGAKQGTGGNTARRPGEPVRGGWERRPGKQDRGTGVRRRHGDTTWGAGQGNRGREETRRDSLGRETEGGEEAGKGTARWTLVLAMLDRIRWIDGDLERIANGGDYMASNLRMQECSR